MKYKALIWAESKVLCRSTLGARPGASATPCSSEPLTLRLLTPSPHLGPPDTCWFQGGPVPVTGAEDHVWPCRYRSLAPSAAPAARRGSQPCFPSKHITSLNLIRGLKWVSTGRLASKDLSTFTLSQFQTELLCSPAPSGQPWAASPQRLRCGRNANAAGRPRGDCYVG